MKKHESYKNKIILGIAEKVKVVGEDKEKTVFARIDTGAEKSSIDIRLASDLRLGPILKTKTVRSALGISLRPVIKAEISVAGKPIIAQFTVAERSRMKYPLLIGRNVLKQGFLIDPSATDKY
jgi:hypothetical protein